MIIWNVQTHVDVHIPGNFNALNGSASFKNKNITIPHQPMAGSTVNRKDFGDQS